MPNHTVGYIKESILLKYTVYTSAIHVYFTEVALGQMGRTLLASQESNDKSGF